MLTPMTEHARAGGAGRAAAGGRAGGGAGRPAGAGAGVQRRRRGEELEAALLEAAWQELVEAGFARLTMESVAARARTGVAVLYRRWPNKDELVLAAVRHYESTHPVTIPDTGSLREDMIALLSGLGSTPASFAAIVGAIFSGLLASSGLTPAQVREHVLGDRRPQQPGEIYARAHERGEIDLAAIPPAVLAMPFDLIRHDFLTTYQPVAAGRIREIVDDLFMPLVTGAVAGPGPAAGARAPLP